MFFKKIKETGFKYKKLKHHSNNLALKIKKIVRKRSYLILLKKKYAGY